jgi:hypothetical protein
MHIRTYKKYLPHSIAGLFGAIIFFCLFSEIISPTYIDWILNVKSDPFQHFTSWLFFRAGPWQLPIIAPYIIYPIGTSIVFTDAIPLFAIIFKIINSTGILPDAPIQYFGIWLFLGSILQSICAYILIQKISKNTVVAIIGSILFTLNAPMILRMMGHFALSMHALILFALIIYSTSHTIKKYIYWGLLFFFALLIHAYLFIMIIAIYIADILRQLWITKKNTYIQTIRIMSIHLVLILITMWAVGYFTVSNGGSSTGFGTFSMNVLSIVNPYDANGIPWSRILPIRGTGPYQHEGFNYIGIAALIQLGILLCFILFQSKTRITIRSICYTHWPLGIMCVLLSLFAVSSTVWIGPYTVLDIPILPFIDKALNTFRSSGRLFWPVLYILLLSSFYIYRFLPKRISVLLITILVSLQIYDMWPRLVELDKRYEDITYTSSLQDVFWKSIPGTYTHVVMIPGYIPSRYEDITFFAATQGLTINDFSLARELPNHEEHKMKEIENIQSGNLEQDTIYIIVDYRPEKYITTSTRQHAHIQYIDDMTVLTKYR